eukprot:SAG31_NODE_1036_length_10221_cov_170.602326_5_plen_136_part_00
MQQAGVAENPAVQAAIAAVAADPPGGHDDPQETPGGEPVLETQRRLDRVEVDMLQSVPMLRSRPELLCCALNQDETIDLKSTVDQLRSEFRQNFDAVQRDLDGLSGMIQEMVRSSNDSDLATRSAQPCADRAPSR